VQHLFTKLAYSLAQLCTIIDYYFSAARILPDFMKPRVECITFSCPSLPTGLQFYPTEVLESLPLHPPDLQFPKLSPADLPPWYPRGPRFSLTHHMCPHSTNRSRQPSLVREALRIRVIRCSDRNLCQRSNQSCRTPLLLILPPTWT